MRTPDIGEHHNQLRAWAKGMYGTEAATELLIRGFGGRFADPACPWIHQTASGHWIDFESIPALIDALSGGEQRFLRIAAALGDNESQINLGSCLAGLDRPHTHLVLAAVAHATGNHEHQDITIGPDGTVTFARPGALYGWDQGSAPCGRQSGARTGLSR